MNSLHRLHSSRKIGTLLASCKRKSTMPLLAPSGWHWPPRVVAKTSGRQKTDSEWDSQVIYWMTVAFTFWLLVHSVLQALAIEWTWRAQPLKRDEMSWWSTHTHLTSGCRLKRSVARRKTMGWPPNAIQPAIRDLSSRERRVMGRQVS